MTTVVDDGATSTKVLNPAMITTIPNSRAEHCVYTYRTDVDKHFDIKRPGFFNPAYTFLTVGDIIRVFRFEQSVLIMYYEFVATKIDKITKQVEVALLFEKNVQNNIIGKAK